MAVLSSKSLSKSRNGSRACTSTQVAFNACRSALSVCDRVGGGFRESISSLHALQAGVLGSQPPVPVVALTGDDQVCALSRRIASRKETRANDFGTHAPSRNAACSLSSHLQCENLLLDFLALGDKCIYCRVGIGARMINFRPLPFLDAAEHRWCPPLHLYRLDSASPPRASRSRESWQSSISFSTSLSTCPS